MIHFFIIVIFIHNSFQRADVFFTKEITPSNMVNIYKKLNITLPGNIGLKIHSGEIGGKYFLHPNFLQEIYEYTNGTFIETNTAYKRGRHTTELHKNLLKDHGWLDNNRKTIIMDEDPLLDYNLSISNHQIISENIVGNRLKEFDSCIVLSHLKGHSMGGFGGALKQLSIGFASQAGKAWIHTAGKTTKWTDTFSNKASQEKFTAAMGDAASSIVEYFKKKGDIAFINVMANISMSCDCAGGNAPEPKIKDIGILASRDPVALDRACLDLIKKYEDIGTNDWLNQVNNKMGENTIYVAEKHGIGNQEYNLIDIDENDDDMEDKDEYEEEKNEGDKENNENGKNNIGLKITFIIILIIVIFGVIGYIIYKRRKGHYEETINFTDKTY